MKNVKTYTFGIARNGITDCPLFISDGNMSKVFGVDSEAWQMVFCLMTLKPPIGTSPHSKLPDNHIAASIARHLLYSDTSSDELDEEVPENL